MNILQRSDVRRIDQATYGRGITESALIEEVGTALAKAMEERLTAGKKVLFLIGPGNNGADGLVCAKILSANEIYSIDLFTQGQLQRLSSAKQDDITIAELVMSSYDVIVDSLFGIGLNQEIKGEYAQLIKEANKSEAYRIAIDIASGVDCDNGKIGTTTFDAHLTLAVGYAKQGHFLVPGQQRCGELKIVMVESLQASNNQASLMTPLPAMDLSPLQPTPSSHKYSRGKVAVALSEDFPGAALLAAQAAQNAGAGYVYVYCPTPYLHPCQITHPNIVFLSYGNFNELKNQLNADDFDCLILGTGWRQPPQDFQLNIKPDSQYIFDGGFLNRPYIDLYSEKEQSQIVITPHRGEFRNLVSAHKNEDAKWDLCQDLLESFHGVLIAKGYDTLIANRDQGYQITTWNCTSLATAGSGDILCGILAACLAKGIPPFVASGLAVFIHRELARNNPMTISPTTLLKRIECVLNGLPPKSTQSRL